MPETGSSSCQVWPITTRPLAHTRKARERAEPLEQLPQADGEHHRRHQRRLEAQRLVVAEELRATGSRMPRPRPPRTRPSGAGPRVRPTAAPRVAVASASAAGEEPGAGGHQVDQAGELRRAPRPAERGPEERHAGVPPARVGPDLVGECTPGPLVGDEHEVAHVVAVEEPLDARARRQQEGDERVADEHQGRRGHDESQPPPAGRAASPPAGGLSPHVHRERHDERRHGDDDGDAGRA